MQLFEEHSREYETLTRPGPLKIGVQIRAGDQRMEEGAVHLQMFDHFFDCASQIEVGEGCRGVTERCCSASVPPHVVCPAPGVASGEKYRQVLAGSFGAYIACSGKASNITACLLAMPPVTSHVHASHAGEVCMRRFLMGSLCCVLQRDYRLHGQEVLWFLITDSTTIRREVRNSSKPLENCSQAQHERGVLVAHPVLMKVIGFLFSFSWQAQEKYGDKLLTASPDMAAKHFLLEKGNTPSLRAAAMDQWLFGLADFHVRALPVI